MQSVFITSDVLQGPSPGKRGAAAGAAPQRGPRRRRPPARANEDRGNVQNFVPSTARPYLNLNS